jgi:hypothetical protein
LHPYGRYRTVAAIFYGTGVEKRAIGKGHGRCEMIDHSLAAWHFPVTEISRN